MDESYFDLNLPSSKLNKTFLHENWLEDYEKEQLKKQTQKRNKKRKRSPV